MENIKQLIDEWMNSADYDTLKATMLLVMNTMTDEEVLDLFHTVQVMHNAWDGQFRNCPPIQIHAIAYKELERRGY